MAACVTKESNKFRPNNFSLFCSFMLAAVAIVVGFGERMKKFYFFFTTTQNITICSLSIRQQKKKWKIKRVYFFFSPSFRIAFKLSIKLKSFSFSSYHCLICKHCDKFAWKRVERERENEDKRMNNDIIAISIIHGVFYANKSFLNPKKTRKKE